jgi:hypothetical protein
LFKKDWKNRKYPARVGYAKIGKKGLWYECWNAGTWKPTLKTRFILFLRKAIFKKPTSRTMTRIIKQKYKKNEKVV